MLERLKEYLSNLPNRRKRIDTKFGLQDSKQVFNEENLFDRMKGKENDSIPTG